MPSWNDLSAMQGQTIYPSSANLTIGVVDRVNANSTLIAIPANSLWVGSVVVSGYCNTGASTAVGTANYVLIASSSTVIVGYTSAIVTLNIAAGVGSSSSEPGANSGTLKQNVHLMTGQSSAYVSTVAAGNGSSLAQASFFADGVVIPRSY